MALKRKLISSFLILICFSCGCSDRHLLGEEYFRKELESTITNPDLHNVVDKSTEIVKEEETAIHIAEGILFDMYGEDNIKKQRPYEIYKFGKYWTIGGTIPRDMNGGTFFIILDATDSRVLRISHGK